MKLIKGNFTYSWVNIEPIGGFFQCFGLQAAFLVTESLNSLNKYLGYSAMFTLVPFINIISLCLDKLFYKWNRIQSAYTLFLGYAITLKK